MQDESLDGGGNFFLAVISVMTETSDDNGRMSSHHLRRLET